MMMIMNNKVKREKDTKESSFSTSQGNMYVYQCVCLQYLFFCYRGVNVFSFGLGVRVGSVESLLTNSPVCKGPVKNKKYVPVHLVSSRRARRKNHLPPPPRCRQWVRPPRCTRHTFLLLSLYVTNRAFRTVP